LAQNRVYAVHESRDGTVWAGTLAAGLSRLKNGKFTTYTQATGLLSNTINAIAESSDGTMWFATPDGLSAFSNGRWRSYTAQDGLPPGNVNCLFEDSRGPLWVGTENGVSFLRSGTVQMLNDLPDSLREEISGIAEDKAGALWIATAKYVLRVDRDKLVRGEIRMADVIEYGWGGLLIPAGTTRHKSVLLDPAGQIWFSTAGGLSYVNPKSLKSSSTPALVHVDGVFADGRSINLGQEIRVSAPHQKITLAYTGLSLSVPERVRFMYRLDGFDQGWTEPTPAREAVYTNLEPGSYRFRVIASNSDGVWNSSEADLEFQIEPTLWQTAWFRVCAALTVVFAVLAFFRLRMLALARNMRLRFEERLAERTRIAQELHDTLLQGVISASMQLHVVGEQIPAGSTAKRPLERLLALMDRITEEGRNAVGGLRTRGNKLLDLARAFSEIREEFGKEEKIGFEVLVEGHPQPLHPVIRDEIYSIGREALINAFRHAQAQHIEVKLEYLSHGLRLLVQDSGVGFDSDVLRYGRMDTGA
jgi:signal transduction histidine kinase